jgi:hypothetical protein
MAEILYTLSLIMPLQALLIMSTANSDCYLMFTDGYDKRFILGNTSIYNLWHVILSSRMNDYFPLDISLSFI